MNGPSRPATSRRQLLKFAGAGLVLIPLVNLSGCAEEEEPTRMAPPEEPPPLEPEPVEPMASTPEEEVEEAQLAEIEAAEPAPSTAELEKLEESDSTAQALGYKHSADEIDASAYPRYEEGQRCDNCALYGDVGQEQWGSCSIFPGKLVNAAGWCSAYAPAA